MCSLVYGYLSVCTFMLSNAVQVPATVLVRVTHPIFHVAAVPAAQPSALASGLRDSEPPSGAEGVASPKNNTPGAPPAKLGSLQVSS